MLSTRKVAITNLCRQTCLWIYYVAGYQIVQDQPDQLARSLKVCEAL